MSRRTIEPKPLYLLPPEIDLLLSKLDREVRAEANLILRLVAIKQAFRDDAERVRELAKREKANGFWEDDHSANGAIKRIRRDQRQELEEVQKEIAALPPEQMRELLKKERLRGGTNR